MRVHVTLMGVLKQKTPEGGLLDLSDGANVQAMLEALDISRKQVQVVSINGAFERDLGRMLASGDQVTVLAPVSGG